MQDYYSATYPNIDIKVQNSILGAGLDLRFSSGNKSVEGFNLFSYALQRYDDNLAGKCGGTLIQTLRHENFHLVDYLINPKKLARKCESIETFGNKVNSMYGIYFEGLYQDKLPRTTPDLSLQNRLTALKDHIIKFFQTHKLSFQQRTVLLQDWRNSISSEHGAFSEEVLPLSIDFPEYIEVCTRGRKRVEQAAYPQKSKLLDEMLKNELISHRKNN